MRLTVHEFVTIDGVMQGPGGPDEDRDGGFGAGGWAVPAFDDEVGQIVESWFRRTGEVLLGRSTWEMMRPYWSRVEEDGNRIATVLNTYVKNVVTSRPLEPAWGDSRAISLAEVARLKEHPGGELQVHGSWRLVQALSAAGLVDEYRVITFPVTVGRGKRLFDQGLSPLAYAVTDTRVTKSGAIYTVLTPSGPLAVDEFVVVDGKGARESERHPG